MVSSASPRLCKTPELLSLAETQRIKGAIYDGGQYK